VLSIGENMKFINCIFIYCFFLILLISPAWADTFEGLVPGKSCRGEVYQTLGKPLEKTQDARTCWFDPAPFQGKSIKVEFFKSGLLKFITLEPEQGYSLGQYEAWLGLGKADREEVKNEKRYHYYDSKGITLIQGGLERDTLVTYFRHYRVGNSKLSEQWRAIEKEFFTAAKNADCSVMAQTWQKGRQKFPKISSFIVNQLYWLITCEDYPETDGSELLSLAKKAIELNPDGIEYINLGWIYYYHYKDWTKALSAFSKVNLKEYPEIHYFLGNCLEKKGAAGNKAREHYRAYLRAQPDGKWKEKVQEKLDRL